jgi:hypothetical protein
VRLDEKKKTGRPLKLTEARFRRMIFLIREGNTNSAACRIEAPDNFAVIYGEKWDAKHDLRE